MGRARCRAASGPAQQLHDLERQLQRLLVVQARVDERLVAPGQPRVVDLLGAAQHLGDVVTDIRRPARSPSSCVSLSVSRGLPVGDLSACYYPPLTRLAGPTAALVCPQALRSADRDGWLSVGSRACLAACSSPTSCSTGWCYARRPARCFVAQRASSWSVCSHRRSRAARLRRPPTRLRHRHRHSSPSRRRRARLLPRHRLRCRRGRLRWTPYPSTAPSPP
jgi:hypothetical protein